MSLAASGLLWQNSLTQKKVPPIHNFGVKWIDMHELCAIALETSIYSQVFVASSHSLGMQERLDVESNAERATYVHALSI